MQGHFEIRKDLINDMIIDTEEVYECKFKNLKLSSSFISWLLRHYSIVEGVVYFFDSTPDRYDDGSEILYEDLTNSELFNIISAYEKDRMMFCNWQEVIGGGKPNSRYEKSANDRAKYFLHRVRKFNISKKDRIYMAESEDFIFIYCYFRDCKLTDYYFKFKKRECRR